MLFTKLYCLQNEAPPLQPELFSQGEKGARFTSIFRSIFRVRGRNGVQRGEDLENNCGCKLLPPPFLAPLGALVVVVFLDRSVHPSVHPVCRFECSQLFYVKLWSQAVSSWHHQCIINASSMDHQCITNASPVHHQCIIDASSEHH